MSLKERIYSVLVVSSSERFNSALADMLPASRCEPVRMEASVSAAERAFAEREFDFVIINSPVGGETGERFAIDACGSGETVVLFIVKSEFHEEIYDRVTEHGVFTLAKPTSRAILSAALSWMAGARERMRRSGKKNLSIEEKMEEIRLVNRAKWLLISELKMDEPEAHRYIEKQAMDRCVSKREVAVEIIRTYS